MAENNAWQNHISIEGTSLKLRFDDTVILQNFSFKIEAGECVLLKGPSGIGKTTLLRIMAGLSKQDEGEVRFSPAHPDRIGMVFQEDRLAEHMNAVDNLLLVNPALSKETTSAALLELLTKEEIDKPVRLLSGGERRRVCVARAILSDAPLLLLDEPFTGLDDKNHEKTADFIARHRAGRTLVLTSHDETYLDDFRIIGL